MNKLGLLSNYTVSGLKNAWRNRFFSSISLAGLTVGFCAALAVFLFISRETGYDGFFGDSARIYRFVTSFTVPGRGPIHAAQSSPAAAANLPRAFPGINLAARLAPAEARIDTASGGDFRGALYYADPSFLEMFDFPVRAGPSSEALAAPNSMVVTETIARKLFGRPDVVGETVTLDGGQDFTITAVLRDLPRNTHFDFQILAAFDSPSNRLSGEAADNWYDISVYTYLRLDAGADAQGIRDRFEGYIAEHVPPHQIAAMTSTDYFDFDLEPVSDIHLFSARAGQMKLGGDAVLVSAMGGVLALILFIAATNYINLGMVAGAKRAREVGLRKTVGATRFNLIAQFMTENLFFSFLALLLAVLAFPLVLPFLEALVGERFSLTEIFDLGYIAGVVSLTIAVAALAGAYPMLHLANSIPAKILAGSGGETGSTAGVRRLRFFAVFVQFIIAVTLIAMTISIQRQIEFIKQLPLGFNPHNLVIVDGLRQGDTPDIYDALKNQLLAHPDIDLVATSAVAPPDLIRDITGVQKPGETAMFALSTLSVGPDFFETYAIGLAAGRRFTPTAPDGPEDEQVIEAIINQGAARLMGFETDAEALERPLFMPTSPGEGFELSVIGVVNDFHMRSARETIEPAIIFGSVAGLHTMAVRIDPALADAAIGHLEEVWNRLAPDRPISWSFMDDRLAKAYDDEARQFSFFVVFAILSIFLTVLGLAGLAANLAKERQREIAIRKVFGAASARLAGLIIRDSLKPVLCACIVSWPIAYLAISSWLNRFAHRIEGELPLTLFMASAISILVAMVTVYGFTRAAIQATPAAILRHE